MQRNAPARGAVGTRSVDVSAGSVASGAGALGSLIPHARAIRALVIAMIEAAFGTAPMALARGADRARGAPPCDTPASNTRGRDHTSAQIAKRRLQRRQVFWRSGASTTSERRRASTGHGASNRGTRETTGSVRRSIEAVTEGLEVPAPGPHLNPPQPVSLQQSGDFEGALGGSCSPSIGVIATAAERLHGSSMTAEFRRGSVPGAASTRVQIYAVSGER